LSVRDFFNLIKRTAASLTGYALPLTKSETWSLPKDQLEAVQQADAKRGLLVRDKPAAAGNEVVLDVTVAYTKKAAGNYGDITRELVDLAIEEANHSFRNSGLGNIRLRLAHSYQTNYVAEGEHVQHLWRFADRGDG
jgi:hypothetical protein